MSTGTGRLCYSSSTFSQNWEESSNLLAILKKDGAVALVKTRNKVATIGGIVLALGTDGGLSTEATITIMSEEIFTGPGPEKLPLH